MGGGAALVIIPDSSFVCFIFSLCQHSEAGQRDRTQHRLSAKHATLYFFLWFSSFLYFCFLGVFLVFMIW